MYLEDLRIFCKELHHRPGNEIRAGIDYKIRELERNQRMQIPHRYDYGEFVEALQRLRQYTFDTGIPPGTTEDEGISILDFGLRIADLQYQLVRRGGGEETSVNSE